MTSDGRTWLTCASDACRDSWVPTGDPGLALDSERGAVPGDDHVGDGQDTLATGVDRGLIVGERVDLG